jgi:hypothetical protein
MKRNIALLMTGLLSACLVGCATTGQRYDDGKIARIKKDLTTEAELLDWFGPASGRTLLPDGSKTLNWKYPQAMGHSTGSPGRLEVRLGSDDRVTTYSATAGSK